MLLNDQIANQHRADRIVGFDYDWSGFYVGVFGGGGFGNHNLNNANGVAFPFANFTINYDSTGGIAGGEVGYNMQSGNIVFGVEADGFWSGIKGLHGYACLPDILWKSRHRRNQARRPAGPKRYTHRKGRGSHSAARPSP